MLLERGERNYSKNRSNDFPTESWSIVVELEQF